MKSFSSLPAAKVRVVVFMLFAAAFAFAVAMGSALYISTVHAAEAVEGEWTARTSAKHPGELQLNFTRRSEHGYNNNGETYKLSEIRGLANDALTATARVDVRFSIDREAGSLQCEGMFRDGMGAGFWKFAANEAFRTEMKTRGYGTLTDEEMLRAAFSGITTRYIDELKSAGYGDLDFKGLTRAANHEITVAYIKEMKASYPSLTMDELIRARNHDVDAAVIKQVRDMGFDKQPLETVIRMQNHDVTPDFIASMKSAGFTNLSIEDLVSLKNHDVTPEFVNDIKAEGYADITPAAAIRLMNHDVDRDFIRKAKAQGYTNASLDDMVRLKNRGTVKEDE